MRRTSPALAGLSAVLATVCCAGAAQALPAGNATLDWGECDSDELPADLECASLDVPVDWDDPGGPTLTLNVARAPKTGGGTASGTVIANFGGPGPADIPALGASLDRFAGLRADMDVVTWNVRGNDAGEHLPLDECGTGPAFASPRSAEDYADAVRSNRKDLRACRDAVPRLFANMDSASGAKDIEAIRAALGDGRLNFFGNSYGGVLGASYARLFPEQVRTMYLDSIADHVSPADEGDRDDAAVAESMFAGFAQWCGTSEECALRGEDVAEVWQDATAAADEEPIAVPGTDAAYSGADLRFLASRFVLDEAGWPRLADLVDDARQGDAARFHKVAEGARMPAAVAATRCADGFAFRGYEDYRTQRRAHERSFPNFGGAEASYRTACSGWPLPAANPTGPLPSEHLPPFLGAAPVPERDAVRAVTGQAPGSAVIEFDGTGHGLYLNEGNTCVIAHADRYLTDGVLPEDGTACPPNGRG